MTFCAPRGKFRAMTTDQPPWWATDEGEPVVLRRIGNDFIATGPDGRKWLIGRAEDVYPVDMSLSDIILNGLVNDD